MRLVVANLEQLRRAASYISNVLIILVVGAWVISLFLPWQHPPADVFASLFLGLAVAAKFAIRDERSMSARTVRFLEIVGSTGLLLLALTEVYQAVRGGIHNIGLAGHAFNIAILMTIAVIFRKNVLAARSMISRN